MSDKKIDDLSNSYGCFVVIVVAAFVYLGVILIHIDRRITNLENINHAMPAKK